MKYFLFYVDRFQFFVGFFFLFLVSACQNFCSCCSFAKIKHYHWQISSSPSSSHLRIPHSTSSTSSTELQSLGPSSRTASKIIVSHKISVISIVYKFLKCLVKVTPKLSFSTCWFTMFDNEMSKSQTQLKPNTSNRTVLALTMLNSNKLLHELTFRFSSKTTGGLLFYDEILLCWQFKHKSTCVAFQSHWNYLYIWFHFEVEMARFHRSKFGIGFRISCD